MAGQCGPRCGWRPAAETEDGCSVRLLGEGSGIIRGRRAGARALRCTCTTRPCCTALASVAVEARDLLTAALAGQDRLPVDTGKAV